MFHKENESEFFVLLSLMTDDQCGLGESAGGLCLASLLKWVQLCVQSRFLMLGLQKTAELEAAVLFPCFMILLVKKKHLS